MYVFCDLWTIELYFLFSMAWKTNSEHNQVNIFNDHFYMFLILNILRCFQRTYSMSLRICVTTEAMGLLLKPANTNVKQNVDTPRVVNSPCVLPAATVERTCCIMVTLVLNNGYVVAMGPAPMVCVQMWNVSNSEYAFINTCWWPHIQ